MNTTYSITMGDRGRLVVPIELRQSQKWEQGKPLLMLETESGVLTMTREQARRVLKHQIGVDSLVDELLSERRAAAIDEDR